MVKKRKNTIRLKSSLKSQKKASNKKKISKKNFKSSSKKIQKLVKTKKRMVQKEKKAQNFKKKLFSNSFLNKKNTKNPKKKLKPIKKNNHSQNSAPLKITIPLFLIVIFSLIYGIYWYGLINKSMIIYLFVGIGLGFVILLLLILLKRKDLRERFFKKKFAKLEKKSKSKKTRSDLSLKLIFIFTVLVFVTLFILKANNIISSLLFNIFAGGIGVIALIFLLTKVSKKFKQKKDLKVKEEKSVINVIKKKVSAEDYKYKTAVDKLYELVQEKKRITIKEAAEGFGVEESRVEEWARILETHGLILVNYPTMGEVELLCKKNLKNIK